MDNTRGNTADADAQLEDAFSALYDALQDDLPKPREEAARLGFLPVSEFAKRSGKNKNAASGFLAAHYPDPTDRMKVEGEACPGKWEYAYRVRADSD